MARSINPSRRSRVLSLAPLAALLACPLAGAAEPYRVALDTKNSFGYFFLFGSQPLARLAVTAWGPKWTWTPVLAHQKGVEKAVAAAGTIRLGDREIALALQAKQVDGQTLAFHYELESKAATPLTFVIVTITSLGKDSRAVLTGSDGKQSTVNFPPARSSYDSIREISIENAAAPAPIRFRLEPPLRVTTDGELRLVLAADELPAGQVQATLTVDFPRAVDFLVSESDLARFAPSIVEPDWFPYLPQGATGSSAAGMEDWLDKPAGKHGGVRIAGDGFRLEDGTPIKFWGTNLCYALNAPAKADAEFTAARFARLGINGIRMLKFTGVKTWEGIGDEKDATRMKPEGLDRLDYFCKQLADRGVYYGWSHTFQFTVRPGNKSRVSGYDELMKKGGNTYAVINWAEDVQDLLIEQLVHLLKHKNRYTGRTYAEDPALSFLELQNEDDIFFWTSGKAYDDFPTYRAAPGTI